MVRRSLSPAFLPTARVRPAHDRRPPPRAQSLRLDELSKFALALNSPSVASPGRKRKQFSELADRFRRKWTPNAARENAQELTAIRTVEELELDHSRALSLKRGDLSIIQGEVFRCHPIAPHLQDVPLIIKRLDCVDRRTYDLKVYEADTFSRFQGHANIVSLYSFWSEKPSNPYTFKTLVLLFEEGILGDMATTVVRNPQRPSNRLALRYLCDMCKGLIAIHNCNVIHGRVKPSAIYLDGNNTAMLGEFGKVELDSARQTHQLFSKLLIGEAIPKTLVYWAPELLKLEKYGKAADMWALGVTLYEIVTGMHPFRTDDEVSFRDDALTGNVNYEPLKNYPRIAHIIKNLIRVNPDERWTANQVLAFAQYDFAVDLQRVWRGFKTQQEYGHVRKCIILLQANIRGWLTSLRYWRERAARRLKSAITVQRVWRGWKSLKWYHIARSSLMRCQANVLARQGRRAYLKYRADMVKCQAFIRRALAMKWYNKVKSNRRSLENMLGQIQTLALRYQDAGDEYKRSFKDKQLPPALSYLNSFEDFELAQPAGAPVCLPRLRTANAEITALTEQLQDSHLKMKEFEANRVKEQEEEERLKRELGVKYGELRPMMDALKKNLKRVAEACNRAMFLPVRIQHPYTYSKWDAMHEPNNVVENVLKDDDTVFRTLSPAVDITLCNGSTCFVSEVVVCPGEVGPANLEVFTSNVPEKWTLISTHKCTRDPVQTFLLPGEQLCKFLRLKMTNNIRGGNIVSVRHVKVKGVVRE